MIVYIGFFYIWLFISFHLRLIVYIGLFTFDILHFLLTFTTFTIVYFKIKKNDTNTKTKLRWMKQDWSWRSGSCSTIGGSRSRLAVDLVLVFPAAERSRDGRRLRARASSPRGLEKSVTLECRVREEPKREIAALPGLPATTPSIVFRRRRRARVFNLDSERASPPTRRLATWQRAAPRAFSFPAALTDE